MNFFTQKKLAIGIIALAVYGVGFATQNSGSFPPPPYPEKFHIYLENATKNPINWSFQSNGTACNPSIPGGNWPAQAQGKLTTLTCSVTAAGNIVLDNIGIISAGWGGCNVAQQYGSHKIAASSQENIHHCNIVVSQ